MTISHNLVVDYYRTKKDKAYLEAEVTVDDSSSSPERVAEARFEQQQLRRAILQLRGEQQQVVLLRFIEGFRYAEIASSLGKQELADIMLSTAEFQKQATDFNFGGGIRDGTEITPVLKGDEEVEIDGVEKTAAEWYEEAEKYLNEALAAYEAGDYAEAKEKAGLAKDIFDALNNFTGQTIGFWNLEGKPKEVGPPADRGKPEEPGPPEGKGKPEEGSPPATGGDTTPPEITITGVTEG